MNAEHSWADAPIIGYVLEYCCDLEHTVGYVDGHCKGYNNTHPHLRCPQRLEWQLSPACVAEVEAACTWAEGKIADFDLNVLKHDEFGKGAIKKCRISPDAFIQMALQMAYYKVRLGWCNTHTHTHTRTHARTHMHIHTHTHTHTHTLHHIWAE